MKLIAIKRQFILSGKGKKIYVQGEAGWVQSFDLIMIPQSWVRDSQCCINTVLGKLLSHVQQIGLVQYFSLLHLQLQNPPPRNKSSAWRFIYSIDGFIGNSLKTVSFPSPFYILNVI